MKLLKCHAENFGKLSSFDYDFTSGLNVICEENGWGKTTFANFLKAMFYGLKKNSKQSLDENIRKRYIPWNGGNYGGYVEFEVNGKAYKIERYFADKESGDIFSLYDLSTNKLSLDFSENIGENVKMKAAGGIASLTDAEDFLKLGAQRLGTSRIVSIAKSEQGSGY